MILPLVRMWINRLDTGAGISAPTARGSRTQTFETPVEVRTYANGRRRSISTPGEAGTVGFRLVLIDLATLTELRTWAGLAVQVRDWRGQKWFGTFASLEVGEYTPATLYSATVTVETTTVTEGV